MSLYLAENDNIGIVRFNGSDSEKFLQGQLTCDVSELSFSNVLPGAYCSPKGRIRANFILVKTQEDELQMILPSDQVDFLIEVMSPYIAFFQSEMSNASNEISVQCLIENDLVNSEDWQTNLTVEQPIKNWQRTSSKSLSCIKIPGSVSRWLLISNDINEKYDLNNSTKSITDWQQQEIKSGHVWIDSTNRDQFLPHDISLPDLGAVSFTKGCYTGQEIVARMHYRGDPKYQLAFIETEQTDCDIGNVLKQVNDEGSELKIGKVVSKLHLDDKRYLICASVKKMSVEQQQIKLSACEEAILCKLSLPESLLSSKDDESNQGE